MAVSSATAPPKPAEVDVPVEDVIALPVDARTTCLRGSCNNRLKYEVEYSLKRGSSDNSYLIQDKGSDAAVLIDVPYQAFADSFLKCLKSSIAPTSLTHLVITHLDPKAIKTLKVVIEAAVEGRKGEKLELILTNPAEQLLRSTFENEGSADLLTSITVSVARAGLQIPLPGGGVLEGFLTPTPRWPDLMVLFDTESQLLYTSKLFSAQVAPQTYRKRPGLAPTALDFGGWYTFGNDWKHYFECMIAPVAKQAVTVLDKLNIVAGREAVGISPAAVKGLLDGFLSAFRGPVDVEGRSEPLRVLALAPMHGPVVKVALSQLLAEYRAWLEEQLRAAGEAIILVMYASAYGNTAALAQAISHGVTKSGVAVETLNLETATLEEVEAALRRSRAFVIGSPTLGGHMPTQVQVALGEVIRSAAARSLPCGVFGSFGWSGEAVDEMERKLKDAGFPFAFKPLRVKFKPTAKDLQLCEESGRGVAAAVRKRLKSAEVATGAPAGKKSTASGAQLAMGRVVGSLVVLTARDEDASSAMLASWVSQASFNPPGITVAVKRDRAMEPLLVPGASFSISIVPEGLERPVMRALARPFAPGDERLAALDTTASPNTGCPLLKGANATLDCQVEQRMEAGDHWVVYAAVTAGTLLDDSAPTAVHHRKVGNHY